MLVSSACIVAVLLLSVTEYAYSGPLLPPFETEPFNTSAVGNAAANFEGSFRQAGARNNSDISSAQTFLQED
jgi:hypothetical protein